MRLFTVEKLFVPALCAMGIASCGGNLPYTTGLAGGAPVDTGVSQARVTAPATTQFKVRIDNVATFTNVKTGSFDTKVGGSMPAPLAPGETYQFSFTAGLHSRLVLAAMFGQSNDWFLATQPSGIPLFVNGAPISGDVTSQMGLWDAGTQVDEEPAVGPHTGPNRATATDGPGAIDPNPLVRPVNSPTLLSDGTSFDTPQTSHMISVTITSDAASRLFTVRLTNVASDTQTLITSKGAKPVRVSPGVWALGTGNEPIFSVGSADRGEGLKAQAENGDNAALAASLAAHAGIATAFSPGVWVVHHGGTPLFTENQADFHQGLTQIAEMGNNQPLLSTLAAILPTGTVSYGGFGTPIGAATAAPILPGGSYAFTITASPGDSLSFATMYGWSNDWFFAPSDSGIALFDGATPIAGDVSNEVQIWNDGAVLSEAPETGPHVNSTGDAADPLGTVRLVGNDTYPTPAADHIRVTITPNG